MKAVIFHNPRDISVEEVPIPKLQEGQALLRVIQAGICGGDIHFYDGTQPYANYPQTYGHEMVGIVEEINGDPMGFQKGDRVVSEILIPCGKCYPCRHGKPNCCTDLKLVGVHTPGAFAQYVAVPIKNLHHVPAKLTDDDAVLVEPYGIGYHAVDRSGICAGETALVLGTGTIGLTIIDVLKSRGVNVIAADLAEFRLEKAKLVGADVIIDSSKQPLRDTVLELTNGEGAGFVFDATGSAKMMGFTEELVAAAGTITLIGLTNDKVQYTGLNFTKREMNIHGSRNSVNAFDPLLDLMAADKLHQQVLITHKFSIDDATEEFRYVYDHQATQVKAVMVMEKNN